MPNKGGPRGPYKKKNQQPDPKSSASSSKSNPPNKEEEEITIPDTGYDPSIYDETKFVFIENRDDVPDYVFSKKTTEEIWQRYPFDKIPVGVAVQMFFKHPITGERDLDCDMKRIQKAQKQYLARPESRLKTFTIKPLHPQNNKQLPQIGFWIARNADKKKGQ